MADAMDTLKGLLGDDAENTLKSVMNSLSSGNQQSPVPSDNNNLDYLLQMKDIMGKLSNNNSDPRSNLLMSLRPYMRSSRQSSIDNAVKLLNLTKLSSLFK